MTGKACFLWVFIFLGCFKAAATINSDSSKVKLVLNLDSRQSFIKNQAVSMFGVKGGIQLHGKWRLGVGYYTLFFPLNIAYLDADSSVLNLKVKFQYVSAYAEYVIFHKERWEISLPVQLGYGWSQFSKQSADEKTTYKVKEQNLTMGEISISGYYRIWNWIGVDGGFGYRTIFGSKSTLILKRFYDAPIYTIKLKIFIGVLYNDIFRKKQNDKL